MNPMLLALLVTAAATWTAEGSVKCNDTSTCEARMPPGSVCAPDGFCSNPFQEGCLRALLGPEAFPRKRVCNSDDPVDAAARGMCVAPAFDYDEIRIYNQNWDGPMVSAWVLQILLSELLEVPTTIETSAPDRHYNFYDPKYRRDSAVATYPYSVLQTAHEVGDCRKVKKSDGNAGGYVACAHVLPMVNKVGQADAIQKELAAGVIAQPRDAGSDQYRWWIPKFLATQNPALQSYFGLAGEANRPLLAETFKRPTDWGTYCESVSPSNCSSADEIAMRAPRADEEGKYFAEGLYSGHFRDTAKNNCTANPGKCTGHMVNVPCDWSNYAIPQAHHLNIAVESDGKVEPNAGYDHSSVLEIYAAANATRSNVLLYWWEPDSLIETYRGTDFELVSIYLPPPTAECIAARVPEEDRCSANVEDQVGSPLGSCDAGPVPSVLLMALDQCERDEFASCSPAYSALQSYDLTNLNMQQIIKYQIRDPNKDYRKAVCTWVSENLDSLKKTFIPTTYPRQFKLEAFYGPFTYFSMALAVICMICVLACTFLTKKNENTRVMKLAQVDYLLFVLAGLFLVAVSALLYSIDPKKSVCVCRQLFFAVGFSLGLIPLMVKVAAINRICSESNRLSRVEITKMHLYGIVAGSIVLVCVYLLIWMLVDPPLPQTQMAMANEVEGNNFIVEVSKSCASSSNAWQIVIACYLFVLLLLSAAITTQNLYIQDDRFNESRYLTLMIYSHLMYMILVIVLYFIASKVPPHIISASTSLILSVDTLSTLCIYFLPKFIAAKNATHENEPLVNLR